VVSSTTPTISIGTIFAGIGKAEAVADGVACAEELLDELLIHHRDGRRL